MKARVWSSGVPLVFLALLVIPSFAFSLEPGPKCEAKKLKESGKYLFCRMKAEMKGIKKNLQPDYGKCEEKLGKQWLEIETKASGACPTTGDLETQRALLIAQTESAAWHVSDEPRFVDNGDGTITDHKTGLMWEKKLQLDGSTIGATLHDADVQYVWSGWCTGFTIRCQGSSAAVAACHLAAPSATCHECVESIDGYCQSGGSPLLWEWLIALNEEGLGGYSDWRIPTVTELQSIVDYTYSYDPIVGDAFHAEGCGSTCSDPANPSCSCTASEFYWTRTEDAAGPFAYVGEAWGVNFLDGGTVSNSMSVPYHARAVRGGFDETP